MRYSLVSAVIVAFGLCVAPSMVNAQYRPDIIVPQQPIHIDPLPQPITPVQPSAPTIVVPPPPPPERTEELLDPTQKCVISCKARCSGNCDCKCAQQCASDNAYRVCGR
jgi:hypothetical protein